MILKGWTYKLTLESEEPIFDPSWRQITAALGGIDAAATHAFAVLEFCDGDYMQAYACAEEYAVEMKSTDTQTGTETQCSAGIPPILAETVNIGTSVKHITVLQGEVLTRQQVLALFRAFHQRQPMPPEFTWRNTLAQLQKLSTNMAEEKSGRTRRNTARH